MSESNVVQCELSDDELKRFVDRAEANRYVFCKANKKLALRALILSVINGSPKPRSDRPRISARARTSEPR